jgi:hypothetical protein
VLLAWSALLALPAAAGGGGVAGDAAPSVDPDDPRFAAAFDAAIDAEDFEANADSYLLN